MNNIPQKLRKQLAADPTYYRCCLLGYSECGGRITWHHAITFKGRQLQERWAILPTCERHHGIGKWVDAGTFNDSLLKWVALNRASEEDPWAISRVVNYNKLRHQLNERHGEYVAPTIEPVNNPGDIAV